MCGGDYGDDISTEIPQNELPASSPGSSTLFAYYVRTRTRRSGRPLGPMQLYAYYAFRCRTQLKRRTEYDFIRQFDFLGWQVTAIGQGQTNLLLLFTICM